MFSREKYRVGTPPCSVRKTSLILFYHLHLKSLVHDVYRFIIIVILISPSGIIRAQSPQTDAIPPVDTAAFPAYAALRETYPPRLDRYALAARFWQINPDERVNPAPAPEIGQRRIFNVNRSSENTIYEVEAELLAIGQSSIVWVETGAAATSQQAMNFVQTFDSRVYQQSRLLWGEEPVPGIDGDPRLMVLFTTKTNPGTAAYFSSRHLYPRNIATYSNQQELIIFNLDAYERIDHPDAIGTAAHEFQHMIRYHQEGTVPGWMDEGYSMFVEHHLGFENNQWAMQAFMAAPGTQLNRWREEDDKIPHYGASMLFISYIFERYGEAGIRDLSEHPAAGMQALVETLAAHGQSPEQFFADWALANLLQDLTLPYGYPIMWQAADPAFIIDTATQYPYQYQGDLSQFATDYIVLENLAGQQKLEINLLMPGITPVLNMEISGDDTFWYAPPLDNSNAYLMRRLDLRDVPTATLSYDVWYDLETVWDYAYLSLSADNGVTWTLLETPRMSAENPNGRAYGTGYTGESVGWQHEAIALDAFIGQEVLLRFDVIMDDSTAEPGFALDNISILETGFYDDASMLDSAWETAGFTRINNQLPQRAWLLIVQHRSDGSRDITRHFLTGAATHNLALLPDTDRVTLAIMPLTRFTDVAVPYLLQVAATQ